MTRRKALLLHGAQKRRGAFAQTALLLALPLCGNGVGFGDVPKVNLGGGSLLGSQVFNLPAGIPAIDRGVGMFDGGFLRPCTATVAIDLDRHLGYVVTRCNDGGYDAPSGIA